MPGTTTITTVLGESSMRDRALHKEFPEPFEARPLCGYRPVVERVAAKYAGLVAGENTQSHHEESGSGFWA